MVYFIIFNVEGYNYRVKSFIVFGDVDFDKMV